MPVKPRRPRGSAADPLELPKDVARRLKQCAEEKARGGVTSMPVKYLWVYATKSTASRREGRQLELEDWLNIVDESASLGVHCMMVCARMPLAGHPDIWRVCQWAQDVHDMMVGLYIYDGQPHNVDLAEIRKLDLQKTCVFVDEAVARTTDLLSQNGIRAHPASIPHEHKGDTCDLPGSMVCVSSEGTLYTCGVVLGDERFRLGNVFEKPLGSIVADEELPHTVPHEVSHDKGRTCTPCPPLLVERTMGSRAASSR